MNYDVVIVGAGPAGLTAALYAGRAKLKVRVVEKASCGGQVLLTELIENFPGIADMKAPLWVEALKKQVQDLPDVSLSEETAVDKIEKKGAEFHVHIVSGTDNVREVLKARALILATGARPRRLGVKGEERLTGHGVSYCATCDAPFFRGKDIAVIGGGDSALEEALYLTKYVKTLTIVHRRDAFRAAAILQDRVRRHPKICLKLGSVPVEIEGSERVMGLRVKRVDGGAEETICCEGVFIFVGFEPDTQFLSGLVSVNEAGSIVTDEMMRASVAGIFACGDCRQRPLYQIVTACSDGAVAAQAAIKYVDHQT